MPAARAPSSPIPDNVRNYSSRLALAQRLRPRAITDYNAIIDSRSWTPMASITIRNLDERTKARLRIRAAHRRRSMEEEARQILREALAEDVKPSGNLVERIRRRFEPLGGLDIELAARQPMRVPPKFGRPRRR